MENEDRRIKVPTTGVSNFPSLILGGEGKYVDKTERLMRGTFDDDGNLYEAQLDNGTRLSQYATAMRELSVELGTDFVDMNALTHDLIVELGKEESAKLFAASAGVGGDYTHPISAGADAFARLFIKNVKDRGLEVAALFT